MDNKKYKIVAYAIDKEGDGHCQKIGEYESAEEIQIRIGHFAEDVIIEFNYEEVTYEEITKNK